MKTLKEITKWLRGNCGDECTAGLTSHDAVALVTAVNLSNLISYREAPVHLFVAFGGIVREMQSKNRWMAYHAIACELDWIHRNMIWETARLPEADKPAFRCKFE